MRERAGPLYEWGRYHGRESQRAVKLKTQVRFPEDPREVGEHLVNAQSWSRIWQWIDTVRAELAQQKRSETSY
jgi:hypothetical protein